MKYKQPFKFFPCLASPSYEVSKRPRMKMTYPMLDIPFLQPN